MTLAAYREGAAPLIALIDAQRARAEARGNYLKALFDYRNSLFTLEQATGAEVNDEFTEDGRIGVAKPMRRIETGGRQGTWRAASEGAGSSSCALALIAAAGLLWPTRGAGKQEEAAAPAVAETAGTVKFLMEQQWRVRMKLALVEEQTVARQITATGRVIPAANHQAVVAPPVGGIILARGHSARRAARRPGATHRRAATDGDIGRAGPGARRGGAGAGADSNWRSRRPGSKPSGAPRRAKRTRPAPGSSWRAARPSGRSGSTSRRLIRSGRWRRLRPS